MPEGPKTKGEEEDLNGILPPREFMRNAKLYVQHVSPTPATGADVIALQQALDKRLRQRKAREIGMCPIREELYAQCFGNIDSRAS